MVKSIPKQSKAKIQDLGESRRVELENIVLSLPHVSTATNDKVIVVFSISQGRMMSQKGMGYKNDRRIEHQNSEWGEEVDILHQYNLEG